MSSTPEPRRISALMTPASKGGGGGGGKAGWGGGTLKWSKGALALHRPPAF